VGVAEAAAAPPTSAVPTALSYSATTSSTPPSAIVPCAPPAKRQPTATVGLCPPRDGGLADGGRLGHAVGFHIRPGEDGGGRLSDAAGRRHHRNGVKERSGAQQPVLATWSSTRMPVVGGHGRDAAAPTFNVTARSPVSKGEAA